ncbi:MAG: hypothetical protein ABH862_01520 [Candidatus Omnitrophota bacterium]
MKKKILSYMILISIICMGISGIAEEQSNAGDLPPGMKAIKVGSATIIAPKDIRMTRIADIVQRESIEQYAARKFMEVEERIGILEENNKNLTEEVTALKEEIENAKTEDGETKEVTRSPDTRHQSPGKEGRR